MPLPDVHPLNEVIVTGSCPTVVNGQFGYIRAPVSGRLTKAATSIGATVGTGDATCTIRIAGTDVGVITITSAASAIGDSDDVSLNAPCAEGDSIRFAMTGTGTGGGPVTCTAYIRRGG